MKVGYIVTPIDPKNALHSGSGGWASAVVACVEPFILVCKESDMRWSTRKPEEFHPVARATPEMINAIQHRLDEENVIHQVRAPEGESFFSNRLGCGLTLVSLGLEVLAVDFNETVIPRPVHGVWKNDIARTHNPSYGWVFRYDADEQLWRAKERVPDEMLARWKEQADREIVELGFEEKGQDGLRGTKLFRAFQHTELSNEHPVISIV